MTMKRGAAALAALGLGATIGAPASAQTTPETITAAFEAADQNGDGALNIDEFMAHTVVIFETAGGTGSREIPRGELGDLSNARFNIIDRDRNGTLSLAEVSADKIVEFHDVDTNDDGVLSVTEVIAAE